MVVENQLFWSYLICFIWWTKNKGDKEVVRNANATQKDIVKCWTRFEIGESYIR